MDGKNCVNSTGAYALVWAGNRSVRL